MSSALSIRVRIAIKNIVKMTTYEHLQIRLKAAPHTWLITGVASFIGSNLLEALLPLSQRAISWSLLPRGAGTPVECVLHQAALGGVPRSLADPITTNAANITGFLNMLMAARDARVKSFVFDVKSVLPQGAAGGCL